MRKHLSELVATCEETFKPLGQTNIRILRLARQPGLFGSVQRQSTYLVFLKERAAHVAVKRVREVVAKVRQPGGREQKK